MESDKVNMYNEYQVEITHFDKHETLQQHPCHSHNSRSCDFVLVVLKYTKKLARKFDLPLGAGRNSISQFRSSDRKSKRRNAKDNYFDLNMNRLSLSWILSSRRNSSFSFRLATRYPRGVNGNRIE